MTTKEKQLIEEANQKEELVDSAFFEFLIHRKFDNFFSSKVAVYRGWIIFFGSTLIGAFSFLGIDSYSTAQELRVKNQHVDSLELKLEMVRVGFRDIEERTNQIVRSMDEKVRRKYDSIGILHDFVKDQARQVTGQSGLVASNFGNISSSMNTLGEQWENLNVRSEEIKRIQSSIDNKLGETNGVLEAAQKKLEELDKDDLLRRIDLLEKSTDRVFALYADDEEARHIMLGNSYEFKLTAIDDQTCTIKVGSEDRTLTFQSDGVLLDSLTNTYLELLLVSSRKRSGLFAGRGQWVTLRLYIKQEVPDNS